MNDVIVYFLVTLVAIFAFGLVDISKEG